MIILKNAVTSLQKIRKIAYSNQQVIKDNIKDVKNQRKLKDALKMPVLNRTYFSFTLHKAFFTFFSIKNKSIIFISKSC